MTRSKLLSKQLNAATHATQGTRPIETTQCNSRNLCNSSGINQVETTKAHPFWRVEASLGQEGNKPSLCQLLSQTTIMKASSQYYSYSPGIGLSGLPASIPQRICNGVLQVCALCNALCIMQVCCYSSFSFLLHL